MSTSAPVQNQPPKTSPSRPSPHHGLSQERLDYLYNTLGITIRTDGWATSSHRDAKGVIEKRDRRGETSTRIMARARKLRRFTWKGLAEETKSEKHQAQNAIRQLIIREELVAVGPEPGLHGLMVYEIKPTVKMKP